MKYNQNLAASPLPENYQVPLSDFALFQSVVKNREAFECILSIFLEEENLKLTDVRAENVILNQQGLRSIRLDAWAMDCCGRQFNAEMQNDSLHDDLKKRARFYQSLMDSPVLKSGKGTRYKDLPETIILFITQDDIFGRDLAKYSFTEQCGNVPKLPLGDGTAKFFLNMQSTNGKPEIVSLLQYMKETRLDNPNILVRDRRLLTLNDIVEEVRQSDEWEVLKMNLIEFGMEKGKAESILLLLEDLGPVPASLQSKIQKQTDPATLNSWLKLAARADSLDNFTQKLDE